MTRHQFFVPPLNSQWLTTEQWTISNEILGGYSNGTLANGVGIDYSIAQWKKVTGDTTEDYPNWPPRYHAWKDSLLDANPIVVPPQTLIQINRFHFGQSDDRASIQFLKSDNPYLTPRKNGGKGKGKLLLMLNLEQFNTLPPMEQVQ